MCTNPMECYMNDIADSVEEFVKKSLILMSIAVGSLVIALIYVMKLLKDRTGGAIASTGASGPQTVVNRAEIPNSFQSLNERVLRDIGFSSCSRDCCPGGGSQSSKESKKGSKCTLKNGSHVALT